jgi:O-antigen/teichoic acid export membrane protein
VSALPALPDLPVKAESIAPQRGRGRRIVLYAITRGITEAMRSARGLLLAIVLGPRAFGIWTLFRIGMRYTPLSGLGVQRGLELEIVQERAIGSGEAVARAELSARTTLGWIIATAVVTSLAALLASFVVTDPAWRLALRAVSLGVLLEELWVYAATYLRALRELRRYALLEIASASVHLIAAVGMAYLFGLRGAIAGFVVGALASLWMVRRCAPFRPALAVAALRRLLGVGLPLALSSALTIALSTVDRLVVVAYGGAATLGLYAFGVSIAGLAASLAWIIRTVIFPDVYGSARIAGAAPAMREHLERTVLPFAYLFPPMLGVLALAMEPVMALALPRYLPAAAAARVFIFTAGAGGITTLGAIGVVAVGRQRALPVLSAIALCINLACSMLALHFGVGLAAVAGGAVLAQTTIAAGVLAIVAAQAARERALPLVLKGLLPLAWCVAAVLLTGRLYDPRTLAGSAASLGTYLLLLFPIAPLMLAGFRSARGIAHTASYTE